MQSNTLRNLLSVVLLIILGVAGYFLFGTSGGRLSQTATSTPEEVDLTEGLVVTASTIKETDDGLEIAASYPQISGMKNTAVQSSINSAIESFAKQEISNFKLSESDDTVEVVVGAPSGNSTFDLRYSREQSANDTNIVEFSIAEEFYSSGAAHPGHTHIALNYDLATGKRLALSDLFTGDYVKVLSEQSLKLLKQKLEPEQNNSAITDGAGPKEENFKVFFPTSSGLKIVFNEYQVAPYVAGAPEIVIPYSALKAFINPNGPLKNL